MSGVGRGEGGGEYSSLGPWRNATVGSSLVVMYCRLERLGGSKRGWGVCVLGWWFVEWRFGIVGWETLGLEVRGREEDGC